MRIHLVDGLLVDLLQDVRFLRSQARILVEIVGEVEKDVGEVQWSSARLP